MKFSNPIPWVSFQVIYQVFSPKTVFFGLFITAPPPRRTIRLTAKTIYEVVSKDNRVRYEYNGIISNKYRTQCGIIWRGLFNRIIRIDA